MTISTHGQVHLFDAGQKQGQHGRPDGAIADTIDVSHCSWRRGSWNASTYSSIDPSRAAFPSISSKSISAMVMFVIWWGESRMEWLIADSGVEVRGLARAWAENMEARQSPDTSTRPPEHPPHRIGFNANQLPARRPRLVSSIINKPSRRKTGGLGIEALTNGVFSMYST